MSKELGVGPDAAAKTLPLAKAAPGRDKDVDATLPRCCNSERLARWNGILRAEDSVA